MKPTNRAILETDMSDEAKPQPIVKGARVTHASAPGRVLTVTAVLGQRAALAVPHFAADGKTVIHVTEAEHPLTELTLKP